MTTRPRAIADLNAAAHTARRLGLTEAARLFDDTADAVRHTPDPGRPGIPRDAVQRDTEEAIRWSPVMSHVVAMARTLQRTSGACGSPVNPSHSPDSPPCEGDMLDLDALCARLAL